VNLFKKNYGDEGFYSGEEVDLTDEENSEPARAEERKYEEPHWEEPETLGTVQTGEVSIIIPPVDSVALRNQSNPSHQSI
jgi:hypothetical protein